MAGTPEEPSDLDRKSWLGKGSVAGRKLWRVFPAGGHRAWAKVVGGPSPSETLAFSTFGSWTLVNSFGS